ncbi:MAG: hypothetical protein GKC06_03190 [Methanomicrobiales archaeon]|nr:hypothetical protein [Methanomicrobiales archaeon]
MVQNNPYDEFLKNLAHMVEDMIRNMPEKEGTHFIGYTIIAGNPGDLPQVIPMGARAEEIEFEVIQDENSIFITGKLPSQAKSAAFADISTDSVTIVVGEKKASIPLESSIDVIHSFYQIRHGIIDIVLRKKKTG